MPAGVAGAGAGCGGAGCDGVVGAEAGFGARFFDFARLANFAIFIPFFFRAGHRALPSWISSPVQYPDQIMPRRHSHLLS